ncbi:eicosanoid and glutathione metabolism membrane-associated protein [Sphingobium quisquiliarum P25]|uniref:Eicosanoid and glutathione metabolism membrane-associated protein n=1 Tax=Sphingobium quisquiliarum P25 TaxID=1329909 RepID=T0HZ33_9SPHN|nr:MULTISPECIES: MAPEG family protein [Sphingobium]EQB02774.1 eicosanoid and glutathione metabolism membrane-associated protein [Sphingobium quisquiliarum P25]EZP73528.1 Eicosanoid and glutathione metabolism membrane-associated protein [Sphingomonas paucimobilis]
MLLPITLTLAAACAIVNLWLATRCVRIRMTAKTLHGDGGNQLLARRMRAHANFAEYAPIVLILFALIELALGSPLWLWIAACVFIIARAAHPIGMDADQPTIWRAAGALLTWAVTAVLAVTALYAAYSATRAVPAPPALAAQV